MKASQTRPIPKKDPGKMNREIEAAFLLGLPMLMFILGIMFASLSFDEIPGAINDPDYFTFYIDSAVIRLVIAVGTFVLLVGMMFSATVFVYRYLSKYGYFEAVKTHHAQLRHEWELVKAERESNAPQTP